ncbi:hypothetical protein [Cellulomonas fengjieae]|uniref:VIT family protein n=1 Tax=Cellulomonas fengjieae TaxID=2819978 RepID=A0ABS3SDZ1_9CELL|nr:hypothetical protein [Cellulomonas fengjieae]MBO3083196.1 hypothetical protein [Cellulomonas fengjieae]QVI65447.1 hypothetical protein KG102_15265 [Cellulomonas fengjieae]
MNLERQRFSRVDRFVRNKGPAEILYGALVSSVVLAATSAGAESGDIVVLATALVSVTYWLAHVYADAIGGRFEDVEHSSGSRLKHALRNNTGVLLGSLPVLAVFSLGRLLGLGVVDAAFLALWFTVALLAAVAALAAHRAGVRGAALVGESLLAAGFGLLVIVLKYLLSH